VVSRRVLLWTPAIVWAIVIFAVSSIPSLQTQPLGSDKTAHAVEYAILAILVVFGAAGGTWAGVTWRVVAWTIGLSALYAVSDELHQSFVPGRSSSAGDVAADVAGAAAAAVAVRAWAIIRRRS
jgi:VanZ family protein